MHLWGPDMISQTSKALGNGDVFSSLTSLPKKHGKKTAGSGCSFVSARQWKSIVTTALRLWRLGSCSAILCTLHRGGRGADLEVNYLPQSSTAGLRVLSLWPLESIELVQSWGESEVTKVQCLFFDNGLVLMFKLGWSDFSFSDS